MNAYKATDQPQIDENPRKNLGSDNVSSINPICHDFESCGDEGGGDDPPSTSRIGAVTLARFTAGVNRVRSVNYWLTLSRRLPNRSFDLARQPFRRFRQFNQSIQVSKAHAANTAAVPPSTVRTHSVQLEGER